MLGLGSYKTIPGSLIAQGLSGLNGANIQTFPKFQVFLEKKLKFSSPCRKQKLHGLFRTTMNWHQCSSIEIVALCVNSKLRHQNISVHPFRRDGVLKFTVFHGVFNSFASKTITFSRNFLSQIHFFPIFVIITKPTSCESSSLRHRTNNDFCLSQI